MCMQYFVWESFLMSCRVLQSPPTHACCTSASSRCAVWSVWPRGRSSTCAVSSRPRSSLSKICLCNQGPRTTSWHQNLRPLTFALPRRSVLVTTGDLKFIGSGRASGNSLGKRLMLDGQIVFQCVYIFDTSLLSIIWKKNTQSFKFCSDFFCCIYTKRQHKPL